MTSIEILVVAVLLSAMTASPLFAQAAIQEPGEFSFYYPNRDVLNGGAPTPAARLASGPAAMQVYQERQSGMALLSRRDTSSRSRVGGRSVAATVAEVRLGSPT